MDPTGDELEVVAHIRGRLARGRRDYGLLALDTDERDMTHEALEEALDLAVYLCCALVQLKRRQTRPEGV